MAATADKYSNNTLNDKDTVSGQTTTKNIFALMPLALTEYRNPATSSQPASQTQAEDDASFKQTFYCHEVWHKKDTDNKECVIGLIEDNPSLNMYKLHATKRLGRLRYVKGGTTYVVLNDGGLNTKAQCYFASGVGVGHIAAVNYLKVICALRTAYYAESNRFMIAIANNTHPTYEYSFALVYDNSAIFPKKFSQLNYVAVQKDLNIGEEGDSITLTISSENEEGVYECADTLNLTLQAAMNFIKVYYFSAQDYDNTQDPTTGTPYAMLLSEDMYDPDDPLQIGSGGVIYRVLQAQGDPISVQSADRLKGVAIPSGDVDDAYDANISELPDGYYYGVPFNDYEGSDGFMYVQILNSGANLKRFWNQYHPVVPSAYHIAITFTQVAIIGTADITVTAYATITGTLPYGGVDVYSSIAEAVNPRTGVPSNPKGTFHARVTSTNHATALDNAVFVCQDGDTLQSYETYGSPASTETNPVSEGMIRVSGGQPTQ